MRKDCVFEKKCYSHGSSVEITGKKMICNDGQWKSESGRTSPGLVIAPGENLSDI